MVLILIISQKFYENLSTGTKYGFYWPYRAFPYWSILEYDPQSMELKEKLLLKLKERAYSFVYLKPDTLITSGDEACHFYLFSKNGVNERWTLRGCNRETWIYTSGSFIKIDIPEGNYVKSYEVERMKARFIRKRKFKYRLVDCWVYDKLECVPDTGKFKSAIGVTPLDVTDKLLLVTYSWGIKVFKGEKEQITIRTPSSPLESTYSHGLLHVALGSNGILTVDVSRGSYTYYRDITAVNIYSSIYTFTLIVEDMDGCLHVFKPVFRPPSVRYVGKAKTSLCR